MRPDKIQYFMQIAKVVSTRATCPKRQVGCVIVDDNDFILSTGYNGSPAGTVHCIDVPCDGWITSEKSLCKAIHAEQNALLHCRDLSIASAIYITRGPCDPCLKMLLATGITTIVAPDFKETPYLESWTAMGRSILYA